ncbi:MAG TPA: hypothetical protein VFU88_04910 [Ktedonobacterales bacterium]|nr:hypothetical protein [Ktedonobacterales bacterium]
MANDTTITAVRTLAVPTAGERPRCGYCTAPRGWVFAPIGAGFAGRCVPISEGRAVNWQDTC